jgi:hypothetical protein
MAEEASTINPSNEQPTTEIPPTTSSSTEQAAVEIVANPDNISWKYPPYCELCNVYFNGEGNSKIHFDGQNHKNRLHTWKKYQDPESLPTNSKTVVCKICWKEMNTQLVSDDHFASPAHKKEEKKHSIVQKLKEDYRQLKELKT